VAIPAGGVAKQHQVESELVPSTFFEQHSMGILRVNLGIPQQQIQNVNFELRVVHGSEVSIQCPKRGSPEGGIGTFHIGPAVRVKRMLLVH
jgi:hypothetical protein